MPDEPVRAMIALLGRLRRVAVATSSVRSVRPAEYRRRGMTAHGGPAFTLPDLQLIAATSIPGFSLTVLVDQEQADEVVLVTRLVFHGSWSRSSGIVVGRFHREDDSVRIWIAGAGPSVAVRGVRAALDILDTIGPL